MDRQTLCLIELLTKPKNLNEGTLVCCFIPRGKVLLACAWWGLLYSNWPIVGVTSMGAEHPWWTPMMARPCIASLLAVISSYRPVSSTTLGSGPGTASMTNSPGSSLARVKRLSGCLTLGCQTDLKCSNKVGFTNFLNRNSIVLTVTNLFESSDQQAIPKFVRTF